VRYRSRFDKAEPWPDQSKRGEDQSKGGQGKEASGRRGVPQLASREEGE
jgi:hypothetical protein